MQSSTCIPFNPYMIFFYSYSSFCLINVKHHALCKVTLDPVFWKVAAIYYRICWEFSVFHFKNMTNDEPVAIKYSINVWLIDESFQHRSGIICYLYIFIRQRAVEDDREWAVWEMDAEMQHRSQLDSSAAFLF